LATTTPDPRLIPKVWAKALWKDIAANRYWTKFMGAGMNNPIQVMNELHGKGRGDTITVPLLYQLEGPGVTGCNTLVGNEEAMVEDAMTITIDMIRHGVRFECEKNDWIHLYDLHVKAKEQLREWWAQRDDREIFNKLSASPTDLRLIDGSAGDFILDYLVYAKEMARMARPKIRPIRIEGAEHYVCVLHPYQARALRLSTEWKSIQSTANVRGESNPIFRGSLGMYDGVILHEHEYVHTDGAVETTGGTASALFFGQQAGVWAQSKDVFWREDPTVDYGRQLGIATGMIYGFKKAIFEDGYGTAGPQDYGLIQIKTAAVRGVAPTPTPPTP
jgi:N4-gp56 family major capsid protein